VPDDPSDERPSPQEERTRKIGAMQRLIDEGIASGISPKTMPEILAEARLLARQRQTRDARL